MSKKSVVTQWIQWVLVVIVPVMVVLSIILMTVFAGLYTSSDNHSSGFISPDIEKMRVTDTVLKWKEPIEDEMKKQHVPLDYLPILLAIVANESGGGGVQDIFQASESKGWAMNTISEEAASIKAGVEHFKNALEKGQHYHKSIWAVVAAYNFGHGFLDYLNKTHQDWTIDVAEDYSRTVVAPSLGNHNGSRYPYVNAVSSSYEKPYAYWNGGNFHYVPMLLYHLGYSISEIRQIALHGDSSSIVDGVTLTQDDTDVSTKRSRRLFGGRTSRNSGSLIEIATSQIGLPYSWGGGGKDGPGYGINDPAVQDATGILGFDCSGFMQYCYYQAYQVDIGDWTVPQESSGKRIANGEIEPGDLLFWGEAGSTYHVAMYIGDNQLIEASTPGTTIDIHPLRSFDFAVRPRITE